MARQYIVHNFTEPTIAAAVKVATGSAIKTLLQVATPSTTGITVVEWGISFDGVTATAVPGAIELIQTDVAATSGTGVTPTILGIDTTASLCVSGTGATCFSPGAEGTITSVRSLDTQFISPTGLYLKQFPLGREPFVPVSKFLRIRVTFPVTVNAYCYIIFEE